MLPDLPKLVEEFEMLSLDETAFFQFTNASGLETCVMYSRREGGAKPWTLWFKLSEEASKQRLSRVFLPQVLEAFELNEGMLQTQLADRLLTQAAYADELVRKVQHLLGEDAVRESIRSTQLFMDNLKGMVEQLLGEAEAPKVEKRPITMERLVHDEQRDAAPKKSHLRIIK